MHYNLEWDPNKAKQNVKKHGIAFDAVAGVFLDPRAITIFDSMHSGNEDRWITLGLCADGKLIVLCHTFKESAEKASIRIISARKATKAEAKQYWRK